MITLASSNEKSKIEISIDGSGQITDVSSNASAQSNIILSTDTWLTKIIKLSGNYSNITFRKYIEETGPTILEDDTTVILQIPRLTYGVNSLLDAEDILDFMHLNYPEVISKFYMTHVLDRDKKIEISEDYPLSSSRAFCDYNNIASKWVLSKIDFDNSNIRIASTSLLRR